MNESEVFVFVKVDLVLHEDGFTKLRDLVPKIGPEAYQMISGDIDEEGNLVIKPFTQNISTEDALKDSHLLISLKCLKLLLSMD